MDLIFKRYASPFLFLDNLIENDELNDGIFMIISQDKEDKDWQYYLSINPWNEESYADWKKKNSRGYANSSNDQISKEDAEKYFKAETEKSKNILNSFKPPINK